MVTSEDIPPVVLDSGTGVMKVFMFMGLAVLRGVIE